MADPNTLDLYRREFCDDIEEADRARHDQTRLSDHLSDAGMTRLYRIGIPIGSVASQFRPRATGNVIGWLIRSIESASTPTLQLADEFRSWHDRYSPQALTTTLTAASYLGEFEEAANEQDLAIYHYRWAAHLGHLDPHPYAALRWGDLSSRRGQIEDALEAYGAVTDSGDKQLIEVALTRIAVLREEGGHHIEIAQAETV